MCRQGTSQIAVEGNSRIESDTIRSCFRLAPGERLDPIKVDEDVKALFWEMAWLAQCAAQSRPAQTDVTAALAR
jgi:outer membrane protein assembly factor BamA